VMDINVTGTFIVMQAVAKVMKANGGGSIVNTASVSVLWSVLIDDKRMSVQLSVPCGAFVSQPSGH
jgi:hypothetical protein